VSVRYVVVLRGSPLLAIALVIRTVKQYTRSLLSTVDLSRTSSTLEVRAVGFLLVELWYVAYHTSGRLSSSRQCCCCCFLLTLLPAAAAAVGLVALVVCATPVQGAVTLVDSLLTGRRSSGLLLLLVDRSGESSCSCCSVLV
jgi:hypothetical protein